MNDKLISVFLANTIKERYSFFTPKPSTPKQIKPYVKRAYKCLRPLFDDNGFFISLPFLENINF